ncbi:MAG TPA: peptidylprolyl isomerase [Candidatus Sulfotelmatobacter sp.]|jgi:peptidyl-prolyl cis-trans isomerase C|nr:peptidylprolyl isomerase [Candidatus Sulfotelmatobacter sp.]
MTIRTLRAAAIAAAVAAVVSVPALADDAKDPVVATVNGIDIHKSAVVDFYQNSQFAQVPLDAVYPQVLDVVVTGQLLLEQAQKQKLESDPDVIKAVKLAQENILKQVWLGKKVEPMLSDDALKARYEEIKKSTPPREEVHARHILVKTEEAAKQVLADLKKGVKFEDEAKAKTEDPSGKETGGDLGFFTKDEMVPEFADAAFKLNAGEVSKAPVKTQFGYHIIKVEEKRAAPPPSFDQLKPTLAAELKQKAAHDVIDGLRKSATVKKFNLDGTAMTDKAAAPASATAPAKQ